MVYVDECIYPFGRMMMCHMLADSHDELISMADKIGVQRKWIQKAGTYSEHFDICKSKRNLVIINGAKAIDSHELGELLISRNPNRMSDKVND